MFKVIRKNDFETKSYIHRKYDSKYTSTTRDT